jgi:hypothetical protein
MADQVATLRRRDGTRVRLCGERVEGLAVEAPALGDELRRDTLIDQTLREPSAQPLTAVRGCSRRGGAEGHPAHRLHTGRDHDVVRSGEHSLRSEGGRLLAGPALAVDRGRRDGRVEACGEDRITGDVGRLLPRLRHAADEHVVDLARVESVALQQLLQHLREQVDGVDAGERTPRLPLA